MTTYRRAEEVAALAWELVQDHHPHLEENVRIEFVWRDEAAVSKGRTKLATARKISGLNAFLGRPDPDADVYDDFFVMEVAEDMWLLMNAAQRRALVDHELCHMVLDEKGKIALKAHDVEEFIDVIQRHGLWKRDVAELVETAKGVQRLWEEEGRAFDEPFVVTLRSKKIKDEEGEEGEDDGAEEGEDEEGEDGEQTVPPEILDDHVERRLAVVRDEAENERMDEAASQA